MIPVEFPGVFEDDLHLISVIENVGCKEGETASTIFDGKCCDLVMFVHILV